MNTSPPLRHSQYAPSANRCASLIFTILTTTTAWSVRASAQTDPFPSWNDTASKKAIVEFVEKVTKESSSDFVKLEERIATFDNDGTLWVEQPNYTQVTFAIDEVVAMAPQHPEWRDTEPFKSILAHNRAAMLKFSIQDFEKVVAGAESKIGTFSDALMAEAKQKRWIVTRMKDDWKRCSRRANETFVLILALVPRPSSRYLGDFENEKEERRRKRTLCLTTNN